MTTLIDPTKRLFTYDANGNLKHANKYHFQKCRVVLMSNLVRLETVPIIVDTGEEPFGNWPNISFDNIQRCNSG